MNLLLAAATEMEIGMLKEHLRTGWQAVTDRSFSKNGVTITLCITSVGMPATVYTFTKAIGTQKFDLALQIGVGGSFDHNIALGETVIVISELFGDLGAEDHYNYLDIFELGLSNPNTFPFENGRLHNPLANKITGLRPVTGLTINTVSGNAFTIERRLKRYDAQVESMEGAAFHYVCLQERLPFLQVRAISNYVEPRDKSKWKMKEAIQGLNTWAINFIETLEKAAL